MSTVDGSRAQVSARTSSLLSALDRHALWLLIGLGALIRLATIDSQGFWLDEEVTVSLVQQGPTDLLRSVVTGESNPSLYYLLQGGWSRVFGTDELGIRSFTALLGTATIPLMFAAGRAFFSRRAGLIAAAFTATSPLLIWYSQEARNYEQLVFCTALMLWCFARALDDHSHRWLWGWGLASGLALATHYFAVFVIVPQAIWLLWKRRDARVDTTMASASVGIVGLALLPLLATQRGRGDWIDDYSLSGRLLNVPEHFLVGYQVPWKILPTLAIIALIAIAVFVAARADRAAIRAMTAPLAVAAGGAALLMLAVASGNDYILSRNVLELWPLVAVALAIGLAAPRIRRAGTAVAVIACVAGVALAVWNAATPAASRPDYSEVVTELGPASEPRLIVSQTSFSSPLILYSDAISIATDDQLSTRDLVVVTPRPQRNYAVGTCFWLPTCGGVDVEPPPPFEPPPAFELTDTQATSDFTFQYYTAPKPTPITRPTEYFTPRVFLQEPS